MYLPDSTCCIDKSLYLPLCLGIYSGIVGNLIILSGIRSIALYYVCTRASKVMHNNMFGAILRVPVRFFDLNPVGESHTHTIPPQIRTPVFVLLSNSHPPTPVLSLIDPFYPSLFPSHSLCLLLAPSLPYPTQCCDALSDTDSKVFYLRKASSVLILHVNICTCTHSPMCLGFPVHIEL